MNDLKFALRQLLKNPGFTAVAVVTLALGIGANTAIFSVVNAILLRPLPYTDPDRLVAVCESNPRLGWHQYVTSMGAYVDWRRQNSVFQRLAAGTVLGPSPLFGKTEAELVRVAAVSSDFFPLLGIQPILGRQIAFEEENPDRGDVVLLSEGLWRERFGADRGVLNRSVRLGDRSFTVVGVMPASVKLFDPAGVQGWDNGFSKCDLWRALPVDSGLQKARSYRAFLVLGRLKPNVSIAQAQTEMTNIARQQAREYPDSNSGWTITVQSWQNTVVRNVRLSLVLLCGAVGFVLLIVAANLANLCLARAASRQKEFAIRLTLGAGRLRMARQFLAESLLLSGLGGAAGLLFARWSIRLLIGLIPATVPRTDEISLDSRVLGFTFATSLVVGLLFGLAPLLAFWRSDVNGFLKPEARGSAGNRGGRRLRASLVTSQVALVMILLTGAGLLTRSVRRLYEVNPGFQPEHLVALDVSIGGPGYTNEFHRIQFVEQLLARLSDLPGVESASAVDGLPLDAGRGNMDIALTSIEGSPPATPGEKLVAVQRLVSPGYFRTMGISLARGRFFTGRDNTNAAPVVIINEALARRYLPGRDPVGKRMGSPDFGPQPCEIVGVINDVRQGSLDATPEPEVFRPLLQECFSGITIIARSASAPTQTFATVREAVAGVARSWPAYNPRTLDRLVSASLAPRRFALELMGLFAGLALVLALVGIYGVLSCVVNERTREIGIRLALGAQRREVLRMILIRGMRSVAVGGLIGVAGACALTRFLRSLLYEVSPNDPFTLGVVVLLLVIVALAACWLPARRAARVDPIVALRCE
ncbi:MAG: permease [Verrucomicrobia bacterium]|nr:MAG: permease [Verrucomicrobiota bacterium]